MTDRVYLPKYKVMEKGALLPTATKKMYTKGICSSAFKRAWTEGYRGTGIIVSIIDTGVDGSHPDLQGRIITGGNINLTKEPGFPEMHGTHVAGTIAGTGRKWIFGGAPDCRLVSVKALAKNGGTIADIITGINRSVSMGASVINMSIGALGLPKNLIADFTAAIENAMNRGVVCVVAAGNEGTSTCSLDPYSWPASVLSAESTAACNVGTNLNDISLAVFSNENDRVDIAACGEGVLSTIPGGNYSILSGTSMATPHVSAMAAIFAQKLRKEQPGLKGRAFANAVIALLNSNTKPIASCGNPAVSISGVEIISSTCPAPKVEKKRVDKKEQEQIDKKRKNILKAANKVGAEKQVQIAMNTSYGNGFLQYNPSLGPVNPGVPPFFYNGVFLGYEV